MDVKVTVYYQSYFLAPIVSDFIIYHNMNSEKQAYQKAYRYIKKIKSIDGFNLYRTIIINKIKTEIVLKQLING